MIAALNPLAEAAARAATPPPQGASRGAADERPNHFTVIRRGRTRRLRRQPRGRAQRRSVTSSDRARALYDGHIRRSSIVAEKGFSALCDKHRRAGRADCGASPGSSAAPRRVAQVSCQAHCSGRQARWSSACRRRQERRHGNEGALATPRDGARHRVARRKTMGLSSPTHDAPAAAAADRTSPAAFTREPVSSSTCRPSAFVRFASAKIGRTAALRDMVAVFTS